MLRFIVNNNNKQRSGGLSSSIATGLVERAGSRAGTHSFALVGSKTSTEIAIIRLATGVFAPGVLGSVDRASAMSRSGSQFPKETGHTWIRDTLPL